MKNLAIHSSIFSKLICIFFLFALPFGSQSQSLELYNINSKKSKEIVNPQDIIIYTRNPKMEKVRGEMHLLNDSTIIINNIQIPLKDITAVKAITPTSQMLGYIFAGVSAIYLAIGIITLSSTGSAGILGDVFLELLGSFSVVIGVAAIIPAIRFLFFGKKYRKISGWVLRIPGP